MHLCRVAPPSNARHGFLRSRRSSKTRPDPLSVAIPFLQLIDINHRLCECLRSLLRKVVADAARDCAVYVLAYKLLCIGFWWWVRRAVGVAFECDGRDFDFGTGGETLLELVILCLTLCQTLSPAVVVDHDVNVIRIVERRGASIECGVVKLPLGRCQLPDELGE